MIRYAAVTLALVVVVAAPAFSQDSASHNKNFDVRSSVGDVHVGDDADAKKVGLPLYPGARPKSTGDDQNRANLSILTEAFGMKLVVANYLSADDPAKILDFYRDKLSKYGKVLECHTHHHADDVDVNDDDKDSSKSKELKCSENSGPVTELKVGTEHKQRVVSVEPQEGGKGSTFALVFVQMRGKKGEI